MQSQKTSVQEFKSVAVFCKKQQRFPHHTKYPSPETVAKNTDWGEATTKNQSGLSLNLSNIHSLHRRKYPPKNFANSDCFFSPVGFLFLLQLSSSVVKTVPGPSYSDYPRENFFPRINLPKTQWFVKALVWVFPEKICYFSGKHSYLTPQKRRYSHNTKQMSSTGRLCFAALVKRQAIFVLENCLPASQLCYAK